MVINSHNKKILQTCLFVLVAIVVLGIGYASISAINLVVNGNATASVNQNNFIVHFTEAQNITGSSGVGGSSVIESDTVASFNVTGLTKTGDYAEAKYIVKNDSNGIGAEITLNVSNSNSEYFKVTETILDNKLQAGEETFATVKVEMIKTPITDSVTTSVTAKLIASPLENTNATGGGQASAEAIPDPVSFSTDSWATIKKAVQDNNTSAYNVGDTKEVTINNTDYAVRISNKTTGEHCGDNETEYSQTACGFVVEFVDIITRMPMRDTNTNVGGYPATLVYDYLNNTLYGQLPADLQSAIKPTRVISGYGCNGRWDKNKVCDNPDNNGNNFSSTDTLYLLSGEEVYGQDAGGNNFYDTAVGTSHQLEYYSSNSVTFNTRSWSGTNYDKASKQYNGLILFWWLRPAYSKYNSAFAYVDTDGDWYPDYASCTNGVAPAFRIG